MKKGLSFLLILVMLIGMMPIQVFATEGTQETEAVEVVTEPTEAPEEKTITPAEDTEEAEPSKLYESEEDAEAAHEHDYEAVVTDPTCTEQGYTTYTCDCGDSYADDYVEPHSAVKVTDAAIRANSLRPGLTEGSHCSACGAVLEPQEEIPAKGYDWMLEDGEFKLLLIGNSFSQDASSCGFGMTESQLYNMLQAMLGEDVKVTLGLLYSGGKGVHWYATQTERGTKAPSFYTITPEKTVWTSRGGTSTKTAITWTDWDVVSLQPYDVNFTKEQEGVPEKYKAETDEKFYPLETATEYMLDFIGIHAPQADVYCYMHWARSSATVASLNASLSTYQKFAAFYPKGLDYLGTETGNRYAGIIPVGLSIQNARTTFLSTLSYNIGATVDLQNDPQIGLQRDGGHVTFNVGRYIAGLTFAEALIPVGLRAEGYVLPEIRVTESVGKLPEKYTDVAQKAVFAAVESWRNGSLAVTNMEGYTEDPTVAAQKTLEAMTLTLHCGDQEEQIKADVLSALPADFAVDAVSLDTEKNTAFVTARFGYNSVTVAVACSDVKHTYENGVCTGCGTVNPDAVEPMALRYDDHVDMTGKVVEILDAGKPTSYQVGYGVEENKVLDTTVVTLEGNTLVATGIGTAMVCIDGQVYEVNVTAAPISLLLIIGQSNAEGMEGNANQSVVCEDGQVYSTYAKSNGLTGDAGLTVENAGNYVPSALTGAYANVNVNGTDTKLSDYPVYSLTDAGVGKYGMDSGLAYEWVQQTGEKVWVVNAAHGGTSINTWQKGADNYDQAVALFRACQQVLQAEIAAGHYTFSHMGYYWNQGCADEAKTAEWYVGQYLAMHENLKMDLACDMDGNAATADNVLEFGNILLVQAGHSNATGYRQGVYEDDSDSFFMTYKELELRGPRVAQIWMANNPELTDIHIVSTLAQNWVTMPDGSDGVAEYFQTAYPDGTVDYTTQVKQSASWYTPTTPAAVKDTIHYNQIGYNEIGREAARNTLYILGILEKPQKETTVQFLNWTGYENADTIKTSGVATSDTLVVPLVYPCYESKTVQYTLSDGLTWSYYDLLDTGVEGGMLTASVGDQTVNVTAREFASYRFELVDGKLVCVSDDTFRENQLAATTAGTYTLTEPIVLMHNREWTVEFNSVASDRFMALASSKSTVEGMLYFFKSNSGTGVLAVGEYKDGLYQNYGLLQSQIQVDWKAPHVYRFENKINADGSNVIHIFVDNEWVGTATNLIINSQLQNTDNMYLSGKDLVFTSIGCSTMGLGNGQMTYLEVREEKHNHTYKNGICTGCGEEASLKGKTLSILGDSISTFANYSNGTAAQTTNSTIANGALYYPRSGFDVTAESTWWYQAAQELDMEILVNNSWSGSCLLNTRSGTVGAYVDRCVQLHDNTGENAGEKPDIIAVFLGTNDYYSYPGTLGSYEAINFDTLIQEGDTGAVYAQPVTSLEAYAISLHKISLAYPDAQVYCFTLLPRVNSSNQPTLFNEDICQLAEKFGAHTVDLYNCGIQSESTAFYKMMGDNLHPDNPGMDAITNAFVSELLKNSDLTTYDVSFALEGTVAMEGTSRTVVSGDSFETVLTPLDASLPLEVTVTMGGMDITDSCWANSMVSIPSVTADVVITAKPGQREPLNFRWETQADILVSVTSSGNTANSLTMTHGSITDGVFAKTRFTMSQGISLRHDLPWCVEWKSSGTWTDTTDGALLFAEANTSATVDACYFYRRHKNDFFALGSYTGGKYHNYGVKLSGTGIDTTAEHVFRLENRIAADGSNMVWLLVDGEDVGPLNHHYVGGTDQKEAVDWVSGKDFTFSYMGTNPHTIGGCSLEYIQVWEKGHAHSYESVVTMPTYTDRGYTTYTCTECGYSYISDYTDAIELCSYRWEMDNNALVSVSANGNTANALTLDSGSVVDGILNKVRYTLQNEVWLYHDAPWAVEWCSTGNWSGMLLSSVSKSPSDGLTYLFRDPGSKLFAFGEYTGTWNNYGLILDCDMAVPHIFRLENRIAPDGTNMVYLLVDDEEVGAMHHHYVGGTNKNATVDWADGKDIVLRNIGTSSHPMSGMQLEYLHIWENGHNHSYQSAVTAPTCTEKGFTTYTCECGGSYVGDYVDAAGHTYENGICTVCGAEAPGPYSGKTIACIGDSITYGVGVTRDESDYVTLLSKSLEMDYIRLGASGTTLCTDGHATCNIGKLTEANLAGADVVTILMGINDFVQAKSGYYSLGTIDSTDTSTIYGATHMWCQRIEELRQTDSLKDTEFYFMTPVITSWNNSVSSVRNWDQAKMNIHSYRLRDLCNAIIEVCALYDIPVIDLNLISGLYYNSTEDNNIDIFGGDGAHPGAAGHQMMASAIENVLLQNHLRDDHDHCYGSWITTTYPDCVNGEQHRVCTICTATESKQLDGMGHTYENGICTSCGIVHTSTFQILDTRCNRVESFTYEVGMTWKEWLNSKYNTGMGSCIAIWVGAEPDILGYNPYMDIFVNGACVDYDDLIQEQDTIELVKYQ